jgi:hypothetical protein
VSVPDVPSPRRWYLTGIAIGAVVAGSVLLLPSALSDRALLGLIALASVALVLEVELPWGGRVSVGHVLVIALTGLLSTGDYLLVVGMALVIISVPQERRYGRFKAALVMGLLTLAAAAGLLGRVVGTDLVQATSVDHRTTVVGPVLLAGVAYLTIIVFFQMAIPSVHGRPKGWKSALSIYLSLLCASALLAVAAERNPALGAIALLPLVVLRFSFRRYFDARSTYVQTTQALSMIPEVAGLTPLGHGERTAIYAVALAEWLELSHEDVDSVATVARLHHIGQIAYPDFPARPYGPTVEERREIGQAGEDILAETGFLRDVGVDVNAVHTVGPDELTLTQAVVRVASTLDDLVGQDPFGLTSAVVGLLARHEVGLERTVALSLAQLCDRQPGLAERARRASEALTSRGAGLGLAMSDR